jgi:hypothetical protein
LHIFAKPLNKGPRGNCVALRAEQADVVVCAGNVIELR